MAQTFSRLTLYALLSAIEEDLRDTIALHLSGQGLATDLLGRELYDRALAKLVRDTGAESTEPTLEQLLDYTDFGDLCQVLNRHAQLLPSTLAAYVKEHTPVLERLIPVRNRVMHSRPLDFEDLPLVTDVVERFLSASTIPWRGLRTTHDAIRGDPSVVLRYDIPVNGERSGVFNNLPLPDYDETGFVGRRKSVEQVMKACLGPYPVVTIVGEGGLGKTALALKVAYDIMDSERNPFEAIVWTTSKTTQLGAQEIRRIENAIDTSLGVLSTISTQLAGGSDGDPLGDVLEQLRDFKILLIIDNLETVLDDRIRSFLEDLPLGSKVLLTSRIGLGALEYPVKLTGFEDGEAVQLLRAVARSRAVDALVRTKNEQLVKFCHRMRNNPLHIKWFVSAVQAGRRPEEVLADDRLFLEFCMSNVYNFLSDNSRSVLDALLALGGTYSLAELSFITDIGDIDLHRAVQQLATTNMLVMLTQPAGSSYETRYELSGLTRAYLKRIRKVPSERASEMTQRKRRLVAAGEEIRAGSWSAPETAFNLQIRSRSDWVVARHLVEAMRLCRRHEFSAAEELVQRAKNLAPDYFEVFRVEASVQAEQQNVTAANAAYEAAVELQPQSATLRTLYGRFLLRDLDDTAGAITQLEEAVRLDGSVEAQLELARAYLFDRDFDKAQGLINALEPRVDISDREKRIVHDLRVQFYMRRAERAAMRGTAAEALDDLRVMRQVYSAAQAPDRQARQKLRKAIPTAGRVAGDLTAPEEHAAALDILQWLTNESVTSAPARAAVVGERMSGVIDALPSNEHYGFIAADEGPRLFFHRYGLVSSDEWARLAIGTRVRFVVGNNTSGVCAVNVELDPNVAQGHSQRLKIGEPVKGVVLRLREDRSFGFLQSDDGSEFYFHRAAVRPPELWNELSVGDRVDFRLAVDQIGRTRADRVTRG